MNEEEVDPVSLKACDLLSNGLVPSPLSFNAQDGRS